MTPKRPGQRRCGCCHVGIPCACCPTHAREVNEPTAAMVAAARRWWVRNGDRHHDFIGRLLRVALRARGRA